MHDLTGRPGATRTLSQQIPAPSNLGTDVIAIPMGVPIEVQVRLEAVLEGIFVTGVIQGRALGECGRCLTEIARDVEATVTELFSYPDQDAAGADADPDAPEIRGELIDLEPALRDALVPTLPFQPVCRADCPGLCAECGVLLAENPGHHHDTVDPRWSALTDLRSSLDVPLLSREEGNEG
ncbi:MAG: YceD family protein [Actinomycetota bacterium]